MRVLRLALSLIRIPHVTLSLFLFPTLASLGLVFVQLVGTGVVVRSVGMDPRAANTSIKQHGSNQAGYIRRILYGQSDPRPALTVCRWASDPSAAGGESPPSAACAPDRLDVAIRANEPAAFEVAPYASMFEGEAERLHVCKSCSPDVIVHVGRDGQARTEVRSAYGLALLYLGLLKKDDEIRGTRAEHVGAIIDELQGRVGTLSVLIPEARSSVELSAANPLFPVTVNVVLVVMISVWLALRAHRKVLEYFSDNGVLLPLVAATGKRAFYSAIWLLTIARVSCFLFGAVPMLYFGLQDIAGDNVFSSLGAQAPLLLAWGAVLVLTLGLLTTIASIADLKHRESILSILNRYVPFAIAMVGAFLWVGSFIFVQEWAGTFRLALAAVPIVGLLPLLMAPIIALPLPVLVAHGAASLLGLTMVLRSNSAWFAAHLEEV